MIRLCLFASALLAVATVSGPALSCTDVCSDSNRRGEWRGQPAPPRDAKGGIARRAVPLAAPPLPLPIDAPNETKTDAAPVCSADVCVDNSHRK